MKKSISVITCTHNPSYYEDNVRKSLSSHEDIEFVVVDTRHSDLDAPTSLNIGLSKSTGEILVCSHHDVIFPEDWPDRLRSEIRKLEIQDPNWAIAGLFGISPNGHFIGNIIDPNIPEKLGILPAKAQSIDELCIILNPKLGLRFDETLKGFHFYGADICLQANQSGRSCYVIDAPVRHLSSGKRDRSFFDLALALKQKWNGSLTSAKTIETTCGIFALSDSSTAYLELRYKRIRRKFRGRVHKLSYFLRKGKGTTAVFQDSQNH